MIVKVIDAAAITEALAVVTAVGEEWKMRPSWRRGRNGKGGNGPQDDGLSATSAFFSLASHFMGRGVSKQQSDGIEVTVYIAERHRWRRTYENWGQKKSFEMWRRGSKE